VGSKCSARLGIPGPRRTRVGRPLPFRPTSADHASRCRGALSRRPPGARKMGISGRAASPRVEPCPPPGGGRRPRDSGSEKVGRAYRAVAPTSPVIACGDGAGTAVPTASQSWPHHLTLSQSPPDHRGAYQPSLGRSEDLPPLS
jgi:hypothetical protein